MKYLYFFLVVLPSRVTFSSLEDEAQKNDPAWSYHSVGDNKSFGIRTAGLDEKADSCAMLVCYARDLEGTFRISEIFYSIMLSFGFRGVYAIRG